MRWIRRWRPEVLFTHDPEHPFPPYLCHRDHRITGRVALDAVYPLARDHLAFSNHLKEGLKPHAVKEVWLFASNQPNVSVDISQGFTLKIARLAHESQTVDPRALAEGWHQRAVKIGERQIYPWPRVLQSYLWSNASRIRSWELGKLRRLGPSPTDIAPVKKELRK